VPQAITEAINALRKKPGSKRVVDLVEEVGARCRLLRVLAQIARSVCPHDLEPSEAQATLRLTQFAALLKDVFLIAARALAP